MNRTLIAGTLAATIALAACAERTDEAPAMETEAPMELTVVEPDTTGSAIWAHLQSVDYQTNWATWPEKGEFYTGGEPHGMLLTTYLNDVAMAALESAAGTMPNGAVIVKENYRPDSTLAAVTVMYKHTGYNADHNDWFFSKHLPSGALDTMPNGMAMGGRVAGCQQCHMSGASNDYILTGDIGSGN